MTDFIENFFQKLEGYWQKFLDHLPLFLLSLSLFLFIWFLMRLEKRIAYRVIKRLEDKEKIEAALILDRVFRFAALSLGLVIALALAGVNLTALITGIGLFGFAFGFALKDLISNFLAGLIILAQKPFKLGDHIEIEGFSGEVIGIEIRHTLLREAGGKIIIVPNAEMLSKIVKRG